jgi:hypothetical protein
VCSMKLDFVNNKLVNLDVEFGMFEWDNENLKALFERTCQSRKALRPARLSEARHCMLFWPLCLICASLQSGHHSNVQLANCKKTTLHPLPVDDLTTP